MTLTRRTMRFYTEWTTDLGVRLIKPVEDWFNRHWPFVMRWRYHAALDEVAARGIRVMEMREAVLHMERELDNYLQNDAKRIGIPDILARAYFSDNPMTMSREVVAYVELDRQSIATRLFGDEFPDGMTDYTVERLAELTARRWKEKAKEKLLEALARIQKDKRK